ncbi:MAG TPA: transposase [Streptosporangiaceae bacterium]|nr:transposase [Streptosporangiaceae bacterium]
MAKRYRPVDRDQPFLFPPDMREWLPEDHPVWLVIRAVGLMDTSAFHAGRRTGGAGTAGYDPDMLVTVLVWAYAHRITSSREIERLCGTDVAFRVIGGGNLPDHSTVARFRGDFPGLVEEFFAQVLILCARLGMGRLGTVALDGMKIAADASKAANRTEAGLRKLAAEAVAAHAAADAAEDALFGEGRRGDEVPEQAWSPRGRDERIRAALAGLEADRAAAARAEQARAEAYRARREAGERAGCPPVPAAVQLAEEQLARVTAAQQARIDDWQARNAASLAATGKPAPNPPRRPASAHCRVKAAAAKVEAARAREQAAEQRAAEREKNRKGPGPVRNVTDPDSRLMPVRGGGFAQGYNTQNVTSADELIIATELTDDPTDMAWFAPMMARAAEAAALIEAYRPAASAAPDLAGQDHDGGPGGIGQALADAGYCSEANLTCPGPDRLIAVGKRRDLEQAVRGQETGGDWGGPAVRAMRERLKTDEGITAYRQRGHIAETPHGHIKHNMGLRQLSVRGKPKAAAEWTFACAIYNLFKAISTGHLTSQALTALTS